MNGLNVIGKEGMIKGETCRKLGVRWNLHNKQMGLEFSIVWVGSGLIKEVRKEVKHGSVLMMCY